MHVNGMAVVFFVSDVDRALAFYTDALGFRQVFRIGDYVGVEQEDAIIHLTLPTVPHARPVGSGSIYVFGEGIDDYYQGLKSKGVSLANEPRNYSYGMRDFTVEDPDGNVLTFGQEVKTT